MSWSSATTALPTEHDPRVVFERMFGETGSTDVAARLAGLRRHRSILDSVTEAVVDLGRRFRAGRSAEDRRVSRLPFATSNARIQKAEERARRRAGRRAAGRHSPRIRRESAADVRPAGAGVSGRRHPRHHLHDGPRVQRPRLPRRSAWPRRIIRCRTIRTIRRRSRCSPRSTPITSRCSRRTWRSCDRRPTATVRCWITCCCCTAPASATATGTTRTTCRFSWWAAPTRSRAAVISGTHARRPPTCS